ncbi:hypothetical protein DPMN_029347 [Dreissena polymorpha]|uniref:Uncharacterized protein n=1 Tax=Dreissena polymorpha TaxID=45954 RepID=A0A9D4LWA6_DREPO|nr:hypothetical protein DPMN_029347 [Dreissena polymorpha]
MGRRTKLKTLCETRWAARADALFTFKASFGTAVRTLEDIAQHNDAKAGDFKAAITQLSFIITLVVVEHVLLEVVKTQVEAECNDPLVLQTLFEKAVEWQARLMLNLHFHAQGNSRTTHMHRLLPHLTTGGLICIYHLRTFYLQSFNNGFYKEIKDMPCSTYYQIVSKTFIMINKQMQFTRQHRRTLTLTWKHFIENGSVGNSAVNRHRFHLRFLWKPCCSLYRKTCVRMLLGASTRCL